MGFSVLLMLMFGWQGATCIDEWTMAACNLAMGATLFLGGGAYALIHGQRIGLLCVVRVL